MSKVIRIKVIRITYCGMDGEGPTVAAAKQDAARKIELALRDCNEPPVIVKIGNQAVLVGYAGPGYGFGSRLITDQLGQIRSGQQYISSGFEDRRTAVLSAAKHAAQCAWALNVADDAEWLAENRPEVVSREDWRTASRELVDYFAWQRRYAAYRAAGKTDVEAHDLATRGPEGWRVVT